MSKTKPQNGVFEDLRDRSLYRDVSLSANGSDFIELILYEDAFEIVNPLRSAKKVHKSVAVYLAC